MDLFDAHCHLAPASPDASDENDAASGIQVTGRILCGIQPGEWQAVADAAASWPGTVPAFGFHPWHLDSATGSWQEDLERMLQENPDAWVGETGLDYLKNPPDSIPLQQEVLAVHLRLARRLRRPVNLHCLKAHDDIIRLLDSEYLSGGDGMPFIMHSFAGPHQAVAALAERGAYFTVGPLFSRRDSERHRRRTAVIPEDRLLLESDAFVTPPVDAGVELGHTLHWLAAVRNTDVESLAAAVGDNTRRICGYGR